MLTSLKLLIKPFVFIPFYISVLCSFMVVFNLSAAEVKGESLQVHGFVAQGIIDANKSNFINDDESCLLYTSDAADE